MGRLLRECEAGDQLSCALLATAYEKGEPPISAPGEIVVRNKGRAAYYDGKACALGKSWNCFFLAERYRKGDGVEQNSGTAGRLYLSVCNSNAALEFQTGASCAQLGILYIKGEGMPWKFKTGLDFLQKACAMGNEYGCKEHAIYGGTGQLVEVPGPGGALGFTFGWSKNEAKAACTEGHGIWRAGSAGKEDRDTCNIRLDVLDHDGSIQLEFVKSRLAGISAYYDLDPRAGAATKEFVRVGELVAQLYGLPSERVYEVLDECGTGTLGDCIRGKKAEFSMFWAFKDRHFILSTLSSLPEEPLFLMLQYESPEGVKTVEHHGL